MDITKDVPPKLGSVGPIPCLGVYYSSTHLQKPEAVYMCLTLTKTPDPTQWCRSVVKYGVRVSQVKPSNCFTLYVDDFQTLKNPGSWQLVGALKISFTVHVWHKSFILDDVKLAELSNSEWVSSCLTAHQHNTGYSVPLMVNWSIDQLYSPSGRQIQRNEYRKINNKYNISKLIKTAIARL